MNGSLRSDRVGVMVKCLRCHHMKKPVGRSAALGTSYCDDDCAGYRRAPYPGSLWPGESEADFGYAVGVDGTSDAVDPQAPRTTG